ncbi:hemerythrin domain-containing protein [Phenylobacterium sp.]|uniref:hemerythrin domain-containing protein n=1 Tax=Phenylobacterium sp. TaxID=1871053 RepID=UPI002633370F|nr:hemerythrin domain-containing protein [Phenylobacterium sp.]
MRKLAISGAAAAALLGVQAAHAQPLQTPSSIAEEHREIHGALERATHEPGDLGAAARNLLAVLDPHFKREEEIAAPPLSLLLPLSRGPATPSMRSVLPMTRALEAEMPKMLAEHRRIGQARARFEAVAKRQGRLDEVALAEKLAAHARQEEEILYPAAIVVGHVVQRETAPPPRPRRGP